MGRLVTRQTFLIIVSFFSHLNLGACAGFALANCDWLGRTIAFYQVFFQQERVAFGKWCIGPQKDHPRTPGMEFFCTVPRPHFLGRALIWPGCFGEHILGLFGLYPSSLSKSVGFISLSGKASLVSHLLLSYFYDPDMFIFCWSSNFVEKVVLNESMSAKMASRVSYLVYYYCRYSEFEQITANCHETSLKQ